MLDVLVSGFTIPAAQIVDPNYVGTPAMNWYFLIASTFILTALGTFITEKYLAPRFEGSNYISIGREETSKVTPLEKKAIKYAGLGFLICVIVLVALCIGPDAFMKDNETGSLLDASAPLMTGMVPIITMLFFVPGLTYGIITKKIKNDKDVASILYDSMAGMGSYIVLAFAAGQFLVIIP